MSKSKFRFCICVLVSGFWSQSLKVEVMLVWGNNSHITSQQIFGKKSILRLKHQSKNVPLRNIFRRVRSPSKKTHSKLKLWSRKEKPLLSWRLVLGKQAQVINTSRFITQCRMLELHQQTNADPPFPYLSRTIFCENQDSTDVEP